MKTNDDAVNKYPMSIRRNYPENVSWVIILFADDACICRRRICAPTNRSCADCNCARISIRVYAPEPYTRYRTEQGGLRGRRSTRHEESEIDKAHVLHAAESPWLEVSTVGLSCRLLIAGTMQQMALIAIPTLGLPALEFSFVLFSLSFWTAFLFLRRLAAAAAAAVFLASFFTGLLPADSISRHLAAPCVRFHLADKRTT